MKDVDIVLPRISYEVAKICDGLLLIREGQTTRQFFLKNFCLLETQQVSSKRSKVLRNLWQKKIVLSEANKKERWARKLRHERET